MGRYYYSKKEEADGLRKIKMSFLKKHGYLDGWQSGVITWTSNWSRDQNRISIQSSIAEGDNYLRLYYTQTNRDTGDKKDIDYKVELVTAPCHYGGKRYWFICPLYKSGVYCGRRIGVLYKDGDYFGCRYCYNLSYQSRNASRFSRLFNVGMSANELDEFGATIKKHHYRGKPTKRYLKYLEKSRRMEAAIMTLSRSLK